MRGPSDKCAVMCRNIQNAGIRRVLRLAKSRGRADPARDLAIIRRAGVEGYVEAGRAFRISETGAREVVMKYDQFAREILSADAAKGGAQ